ncbi:phosphotransferase enzyme family-domain-containing protein [Rostrohypoxylon terebratum]|nr:phosphotransferase enzyme family-domain-containing protein [Rostrohypoxylon terebratum]
MGDDRCSRSNSDSGLDSLFGDPSESVTSEYRGRPTVDCLDDVVYGLRWSDKDDVFSPTPQWTVQPTIDTIVLTLRNVVSSHKQYDVEHLWDGTYNKIYSVSYDQTRLIMRVSLPVCPRTKIESEAATIRWVHENTNLPVPKVHSYDSSRNNPIGFEWIMMDQVDGMPLSHCWTSVTQDAKERIVKQIAAFAASAFGMQFKGIGNLYPLRSHLSGSRPRWTKRRLRIISADLRMKTQELPNEFHRKIATRMLILVDRLRNLEDKFFPTPEIESDQSFMGDSDVESTDEDDDTVDKMARPREPTMLWHDDISLDNIMVDKNGILCGIIGWECVSCLPLYEAYRFIEPLTPHGVTQRKLGDSRRVAIYERNLRQHQVTLLRQLFISSMRDLCPGWVSIFEGRRYLRDYEAAVQNCDNESAYETVELWVDAVEKTETSDEVPWHLHERLMG